MSRKQFGLFSGTVLAGGLLLVFSGSVLEPA